MQTPCCGLRGAAYLPTAATADLAQSATSTRRPAARPLTVTASSATSRWRTWKRPLRSERAALKPIPSPEQGATHEDAADSSSQARPPEHALLQGRNRPRQA